MEVVEAHHSLNSARSIPISTTSNAHDTACQPASRQPAVEDWDSLEKDFVDGVGGARLWASAGNAWTETWDSLSPRLRNALLPAVRSAWTTRIALVSKEWDADLESKGRDTALGMALKGLKCVSLEDCWGLLGVLDALCIICSLTALQRAKCGEQWTWISFLTSLPCITGASVRQAELGVNELTVRDKLGGSDMLRKALAVALLGRLCGSLQEKGPQTLTQLNILCKNISGVLQGCVLGKVTRSHDQDEGSRSEEEAICGMCAVAAVGSLCVVVTRWVPSHTQTRDPSFLLLTSKMLFSFVHAGATTEPGMWCRWTAAHGLSQLLALPSLWHILSKKSQADVLRQVLTSLECKDMDDACRVYAVRMLDSPAAYAVVLNLPNYLSQLLSRLLSLLRPIEADQGTCQVASLPELRWAALNLISRFLTEYLESPDGGELDLAKYVSERWFGACASEEQCAALRCDIQKAFAAYCHKYSLPPADVRLPA